MEAEEFLDRVCQIFDSLGIRYFVTGSMASIAYGEPRFTNDIDLVVTLTIDQVPALCAAFPAPEFCYSPDAAKLAVKKSFQFNILHPTSGLKADLIVADDSEFNRSRFARTRRLALKPDREIAFASPEDIILKKLDFFRAGGSEKHLRDIVGILKVQAGQIDDAYLADWIARLGLAAEWRLITDRMKTST